MLRKYLGANNRDSLVGREIVPVVPQYDEILGLKLRVRGIPGHHIHLLVEKCAIEQPQIHDSGLRAKPQMVALDQPLVTILPLHEFVTESRLPMAGIRHGL